MLFRSARWRWWKPRRGRSARSAAFNSLGSATPAGRRRSCRGDGCSSRAAVRPPARGASPSRNTTWPASTFRPNDQRASCASGGGAAAGALPDPPLPARGVSRRGPVFMQPMRLLRRDLGPIFSLRLWRACLAVLEGPEIRIGKLPVVLGMGGGRREPRDTADQGSSSSHHRGVQNHLHREWRNENRFNGFHQQAAEPQQPPWPQGSAATISTSYFDTRSTFSFPSVL